MSSQACAIESVTLEKMQPLSPTTVDAEIRHISQKILGIISEYALDKFDDSKERLNSGTPKFLSVIGCFVAAQMPVETCLPSFPFKSANQVYKVLGTLPDKAEELALERLNTMCARIQQFYPPGARVTIISDGITYNGTSKPNLGLVFTTNIAIIRSTLYIRQGYMGIWRSSS